MFDFLSEQKEQKVKPESFTLKSPINKYLKKNPKKRKNRWISASRAWDFNVHDFVYGYFHECEEVLSIDDLLNMKIGHTIHTLIQENLVKIGALDEDSVERYIRNYDYGFAGAIDGVVQSGLIIPKSKKIPNEKMHFEIKSCSERAYKNINFVSDIYDSYKCQAEIYQEAEGVDKTLFCFVSRATHSVKCLVYEREGTYLSTVKRKADEIWDCIGRRELPHYNTVKRDDWKKLIEGVEVPLTPQEALANA